VVLESSVYSSARAYLIMAALLVGLHKLYERVNPFLRPRKLQELADLGLACICTTRLQQQRAGIAVSTDDICEEIAALKLHTLKDRVQGDLNLQMVDCAKILEQMRSTQGQFVLQQMRQAATDRQSSSSSSDYASVVPGSDAAGGHKRATSNLQEQRSAVHAALQRELGFSLALKQSGIAGAGMGLWVQGTAPVGSVVGIFGGLVYAPQYVRQPEFQAELFPDEHFHLIMRYDNYVIDDRNSAGCSWHPLAAACMVNHPPQGTLPNVIQVKRTNNSKHAAATVKTKPVRAILSRILASWKQQLFI
jgi:hypothetical protein